MATLRRLDDPNFEGYDYGFTDPDVRAPGPDIPGESTAPQAPPPASSTVHSEWFGGGPQNQYSRGLEDAWLNYAGSAGTSDINKLASGFGNGARAVGSDKIDFGFGPVDVLKDVGGSNGVWFGDYYDPTNISGNSAPRSGGGGGSSSPSSYTPPDSTSNSGFMGQASAQTSHKSFDEVMAELRKLFPNGAYNQDIVNRRTENARENLGRQRKSTDATNRAILASRGTLGSGPEITAMNRADERIADQYQNAVSGIYADESANADQRMIEALKLAAGLTSDEAAAYVNSYNAETGRGLGLGNLGVSQQRANNDFTLGQGNLALGNLNAVNDYNLGLANYGLGRDKLLLDSQNGDLGQVLALIDTLYRGAGQSAGGYR